ncbi:MAG: M61 family peptidase [Bacteroidota bacterium]
MTFFYNKRAIFLATTFLMLIALSPINTHAQTIQYTVSIPSPKLHQIHIELDAAGWNTDSITATMPKWTPGYYQILDYGKFVSNFKVSINGKEQLINTIHGNQWAFAIQKNKPFHCSFDVQTEKQFVANSYVDSNRAYIIPGSVFPFLNGKINTPIKIKINAPKNWEQVATGLSNNNGKTDELIAQNFDDLYDSPILIGSLTSLKPFLINGIEHRFVGYKLGEFDHTAFMQNLEKMVKTASNIIGDIPYEHYSFIGIGPGRGGIEHLNSTTVSFDGKELNAQNGVNRMMSFLAHEYFHHYNVKRIRPFELGPFDYTKENRTNLLWISEGLSVYYEYLIIKRAGIIDEATLFKNFESNINTLENNPGRLFQSLAQASYDTWSDGPFGKQGAEANKSISYYEKGPVVGLLFDFAIRHATNNQKSLDDVMRYLYWHYYKDMHRGFTDAEFQQVCEDVAGISLTDLFEYVYTAKELDYTTYLNFAGLEISFKTDEKTGKKLYNLKKIPAATKEQSAILQSWLGQ